MITNAQSGTRVDEIARGIFRINTPVSIPGGPGHFSFNQFLILDDQPMLFHTGPRQLFALVREAVASVLPVRNLKFVGLSHFEADECGSLNSFLAEAPEAVPLCSQVAAMVSISDFSDRPPRPLSDGAELALGDHTLRWFDTPHMPHGWECGLMMESSTGVFLCGDLFTQGGRGDIALTEADILAPSETFRRSMDYFSHSPHTGALLERLARENPTTLACMHGSAWRGDGAGILRALKASLGNEQQ